MAIIKFIGMLLSLPPMLFTANVKYARFKSELVRELTAAGISKAEAMKLAEMYSPRNLLSEKNSECEMALNTNDSLQ